LSTSDVLLEDREEIRLIWLNRPESLNSLRAKTLEEVDDALAEFAWDKSTKALIITGKGEKAFSAGGDIKEMEKMSVAQARRFARLAHSVLRRIEGTGKPVISAVNGLALGAGCDLALACDLCVASENARLGMPSLAVGVITPFGGTSRLMQRVGTSAAKRLMYTGEAMSAHEAMAMGLVDHVYPEVSLIEDSLKFARVVLEKSPTAFAYTKTLMTRNAAAMSRGADALEIEYYARCFKSQDQKEGARAFMEKRKPVFRGE
jgi:enoyl-CoA hydratase